MCSWQYVELLFGLSHILSAPRMCEGKKGLNYCDCKWQQFDDFVVSLIEKQISVNLYFWMTLFVAFSFTKL